MLTRRALPAALVVLLLLIAAATPTKAPNVTVVKNDGTTVRGQLNSSDLKGVSVTKLVKNQPSGDPVTIPWSDIKSVSNGLTRPMAIAQWKKDHPEDLCAECHGAGKVICPTCKGTGRDPASAKDCPTCHGNETVPCTTPKCDKGKIRCPKMHIRRDEGQWYKKDDGKMWRKFPGKGGYREISEGHIGQIVEMDDGFPGDPHECPLCHGTMIIDDPKCHGTGALPCNNCTTAATKDAKQKCHDCDRGMTACKKCDGTGIKSLSTQPVAE